MSGAAQLGAAQLGAAQLGAAQLGAAQLGAAPAWLLLGLGLVVVVAPRRTVALAAVSLQTFVLSALAVAQARDGHAVAAATALSLRGVALALAFVVLLRRARDRRPVGSGAAPVVRGALAVGLALALVRLVPPTGLNGTVQAVVLALVGFGLAAAAAHRATLFQVLGIVTVENAMALAALALPGTSWLIEVGAAVDITLIALVAGVFHERIVTAFGAGDTSALRSLRD